MGSALVSVLVGALAGTAMGSALPAGARIGTTVEGGSGRASLQQVRNPHHRFNPTLSVYKTYLKFGAPIPDYLAEAVAALNLTGSGLDRRVTGSAVTTPIDSMDDAYVTPVTIGTPGQTLMLDFDTGSSDLWVFSSETPTSQRNGQTIYDPSKSSTSKKVSGGSWDISYGDGSSSSGDIYTDKVSIGGVTVNSQGVETAQQVSDSFTSDSSIDGLVGLGFDNINSASPRQKTFISNAKSSLDSPVFTADLKHNAAGTYDFGYVDSSKYTGAITYTSVSTSQGYWTFSSSGYGIGSGSFKSQTISGIADTGTTLLYLPTAIVSAYYKQVSGAKNNNAAGGYTFPCSATLPAFTFGVGSARVVIPSTYMNYGVYSGSTCFGGLQDSAGIGINIFGDVALKAAFVIFDVSAPRIGWASKSL